MVPPVPPKARRFRNADLLPVSTKINGHPERSAAGIPPAVCHASRRRVEWTPAAKRAARVTATLVAEGSVAQPPKKISSVGPPALRSQSQKCPECRPFAPKAALRALSGSITLSEMKRWAIAGVAVLTLAGLITLYQIAFDLWMTAYPFADTSEWRTRLYIRLATALSIGTGWVLLVGWLYRQRRQRIAGKSSTPDTN